jgi:hypothetical protein
MAAVGVDVRLVEVGVCERKPCPAPPPVNGARRRPGCRWGRQENFWGLPGVRTVVTAGRWIVKQHVTFI